MNLEMDLIMNLMMVLEINLEMKLVAVPRDYLVATIGLSAATIILSSGFDPCPTCFHKMLRASLIHRRCPLSLENAAFVLN